VPRDLVRRLKKPREGRRGLTAPQVLRSLVLMRIKNWDYRELRERIADGVTLDQFTDFYCDSSSLAGWQNGNFPGTPV
jgi:transposase, IS5 family